MKRSRVQALVAAVSLCGLGTVDVLGAGNGTNDIPPLRPPRPELKPEFWEANSGVIISATALVLAAAGLGIWQWRRSRPVVVIPPAVQARTALAALRDLPETGTVLSQVSQVVRHYVRGAFGMAEEEMTTADLGRALKGREDVGPQLSGSILEFLRTCDERKFAPGQAGPPLGAVDKAEHLVAAVEQRREEQERTRAAQVAGGSSLEQPT